jgi:hypothetical protein
VLRRKEHVDVAEADFCSYGVSCSVSNGTQPAAALLEARYWGHYNETANKGTVLLPASSDSRHRALTGVAPRWVHERIYSMRLHCSIGYKEACWGGQRGGLQHEVSERTKSWPRPASCCRRGTAASIYWAYLEAHAHGQATLVHTTLVIPAVTMSGRAT